MSSFSLRIIASDHIFYDGSCEILTVPAHDGPVSILAHHEAVIMATQEGEVWFRAAGNTEWQEAIVGIGIVQVVNNRALVIVDSAERPEEIDVRRAQEALERAEEQMRQKQSIQEFKMSQASMARALSRLKGSRHYQGL
ncbi:MAG: ATP synthase F1 subunit epsilon [Lachnospirales bacterium]